MNVIELKRALKQLRLSGVADVLETRLQQAQAEHQAVHHAKPLQRQLQADHEHHHADAEFGDRLDGLRPVQRDAGEQRKMIGQHGEAVWPHRHADQHEPQYGADAQPMKQGDDDGRSN